MRGKVIAPEAYPNVLSQLQELRHRLAEHPEFGELVGEIDRLQDESRRKQELLQEISGLRGSLEAFPEFSRFVEKLDRLRTDTGLDA
jgi:hypothetical protein